MRRRFARAFLTVLAVTGIAATFALAQTPAESPAQPAGKSSFDALLESLISGPGRQVTLTGLAGTFSANPTVERITVSDNDGPWLELEGVDIAWDRSALLDRTLHLESLKAKRVALLRKPLPAPDSGSEGSASMPVAVEIDTISLPLITLAAPIAGGEAELAAAGSAQLTKEAIAVQLSAYRQDRAGTLAVELNLEPQARQLTADLMLEEPANGLIAELLELPGRPAVSVRLAGSGPLDSWDAKLVAAANGAEVLNGSLAISRLDAGYRVAADMRASLEAVVPAAYASLVTGESKLTLDVSRADEGRVTIDELMLNSGGIALNASGALAPDLVPEHAVVSLQVGQAGRTMLPFAGGLSIASLRADAEIESGTQSPWRLGVVAEGMQGAFGRFARMTMNASGEAENLADPSARSVRFQANGTLDDFAASDPALQAAVGPSARLAAAGAWSAGQPVGVKNLQLVLDDAAASFAGTATAEVLNGSFGATIGDLSRLAGLAGRALAGSAQIKAEGSATRDGRFDLRLDGETVDLALGSALDQLLAGATSLAGGVARTDSRLAFNGLTLANERMRAEIDGSFADPELDLAVTADVADLSLATERAAGKARVSAKLSGTADAPRVEAEATGEEVVLMGRPLADAAARFSGVVAGPDTAGEAEITGTLAGAAVSGSARLAAGEGGARRLEGLSFAVGESRATGDLAIGADGLLSGQLDVVSPDLSKVAPLFLVEASGMLNAQVALAAENGAQSADISATATDVVYDSVTIQSAELKGRGRDLFNVPKIDGDFSLNNVKAGGLVIVTATGAAERRDDATELSLEAELADGQASLDASLAPEAGGLAIGLSRFSFARSGIDLALAQPTTIVVADGAARFDDATLTAAGGSAAISGSAGQELDLSVTLASLPASLVNNLSQEVGAEGTVSGTITVTGSASAPVARFDIAVAAASVAASRNAGLGALNISTEGDFTDGRVKLASRVSGSDGLAVDVNGTVGTAGTAPLDLKITGSVPLSLGNRGLAERGAALSGALNVDMAVSGTSAAPQFAGRVTSEGGGFVDPQSGIVLSSLSLAASVSNNRLVIDRLTAASGEGTVAAEGSLGLDPAAGLPVDMRLNVRRARYVDGTLIAATFDADLTLSGQLTRSPALQGAVTLGRAEITVPEQLPGDSVAVAVEHEAPPPPVERTLTIMRERQGQAGPGGGGPGGVTLDVAVDAPRRIFVRGRGLDAELGGRLRLIGATSSIGASGAFEVVRGRLDILTQRITLDRGIVTFAGDLDPILDFVGTTTSGDVTITVAITGRASAPEITFSSVPDLPQDEILAQLIFKKTIGELSPLQIARLGAAAAELSGGGGGVLSQLRATTGLDDLDIVVDEEGEAALAAGRYISDNVYLGVQQGATAESSRVTIDLDITKGLKARAGYSAEGESSLGVYFEKEY